MVEYFSEPRISMNFNCVAFEIIICSLVEVVRMNHWLRFLFDTEIYHLLVSER